MPAINAKVMANTSIIDFLPSTKAAVYSGKPSSRCSSSMRCSTVLPACSPSTTVPPNPSCGMTSPVSCQEMPMAGIRNATINTQYCAT